MKKFLIESGVYVFPGTVRFFQTTCCASGIMSVDNIHTYEQIDFAIQQIKSHANSKSFSSAERDGGERNILVFTTPNEGKLEKVLISLKFKLVASDLKRRRGYPSGNLKLYILTY